jgi:N-methylhydantoinase A
VQAAEVAGRLGNAASSSETPRAGATKLAYFPATGWTPTPVVDRAALAPGARHDGPLIVEETASTTVIGPGDALAVDEHGNLIVTIALAA